jgi:molybdate transport system substrate-binding protein
MPYRAASWGLLTILGAALISTLSLLNFSVLLSRRLLLPFAIFLSSSFAQEPTSILVAAAADLARTRAPLAEAFSRHTGHAAQFTFASSGTLARQIGQGAPYDVFLSANEQFVKNLAAAGKLRPESVRVYAYGRLALWSRSGRFRKLEDLADPGVRHVAIANPTHAPYGVAAREALIKAGLWEKLAGKVVYGENVQQALQFAQTGNAEVAVTAWPLVLNQGGVLLPAEWHNPIRQAGAVVADTRNPQAAEAFLRFLTGPEGRKMLRGFGFDLPAAR